MSNESARSVCAFIRHLLLDFYPIAYLFVSFLTNIVLLTYKSLRKEGIHVDLSKACAAADAS